MIRPLTEDAFDALMLNLPLRSAMIVDFGVNSSAHYVALQNAVRAGATKEELDFALGEGNKLTTLVKKYVPNSDVVFSTSYDFF